MRISYFRHKYIFLHNSGMCHIHVRIFFSPGQRYLRKQTLLEPESKLRQKCLCFNPSFFIFLDSEKKNIFFPFALHAFSLVIHHSSVEMGGSETRNMHLLHASSRGAKFLFRGKRREEAENKFSDQFLVNIQRCCRCRCCNVAKKVLTKWGPLS